MRMMVHFRFDPTDAAKVAPLIPAEQARIGELREAGTLEALYLAGDRAQGWLVLQGENEAAITDALASLPLHPYMIATSTPLQE